MHQQQRQVVKTFNIIIVLKVCEKFNESSQYVAYADNNGHGANSTDLQTVSRST